MRLDKYLAHLQIGTRSQVRSLIRNKKVTIDGQVIKDAGFAVPENAAVAVDGTPVAGDLAVYYLLNKPAGVVTATSDDHERTVLDLIASADRRPGLFPVGRLDKDTTGLLLLTTDGALGHDLLSPRHHVDKTYLATLDGDLDAAAVARLEAGIVFADFTSAPAAVGLVAPRVARITIHEGKFHQVKRMFHAVGVEVVALQRVAMGGLQLPEDLAAGAYRPLTAAELAGLKNA